MMESLTDELYDAAVKVIKEIDELGMNETVRCE